MNHRFIISDDNECDECAGPSHIDECENCDHRDECNCYERFKEMI